MSEALSQISHKGKTITIEDYTNCTKEEVLRRVAEVMAWTARQSASSLLTLTDVTNQNFDKETIAAFKNLAAHNKPYTKAGALVGISGLLRIAYAAVMTFSGRSMPIFNTRQEALDWLAQQ